MLVMVVYCSESRWIERSTLLMSLILLELRVLLSPTLNFWPVWFSWTLLLFFFFQAEDGIRDLTVTGVQTCALPISHQCRLRQWRQHPACSRRTPREAVQARSSIRTRRSIRQAIRHRRDQRWFCSRQIGRASCRERV